MSTDGKSLTPVPKKAIQRRKETMWEGWVRDCFKNNFWLTMRFLKNSPKLEIQYSLIFLIEV